MADTKKERPAIFKKIAKAQATRGGNRIKDGKYLFTVKNILIEPNVDGQTMFKVEFYTDESETQPGNFEKAGNPVWPGVDGAIEVKACAVGSSPSLVGNLDTNKSMAGNAKAFVCGLLGFDENDVEDEDFMDTLEELCDKPQPGRGMQVRLETYRKKIKGGENAGKPFVGHNWETCSAEVENKGELVAARRARLDKADKEEKAAA